MKEVNKRRNKKMRSALF